MGTQEKLEALQKKRDKIDQELATLKAREKEKERKEETRLKVLIGGAIMAHARAHADVLANVKRILDRTVKGERERAFLARKGWLPDAPTGNGGAGR